MNLGTLEEGLRFYDFSGLNMRGSMLSLSTNGGDNLSVSSSSQSHSQLQVNKYETRFLVFIPYQPDSNPVPI